MYTVKIKKGVKNRKGENLGGHYQGTVSDEIDRLNQVLCYPCAQLPLGFSKDQSYKLDPSAEFFKWYSE